MSKPLVAIDIDEVIFPMVEDLTKYVDQHHKVKIGLEEFKTYNIEDFWPGGAEEGLAIFEDYVRQNDIEVAPIKGAQEALKHLSGKYELVVMTSRPNKVEYKTEKWLERHFPQMFNKVHVLGNSRESITYRHKADVCQELGVYCLIDDHLTNILSTHQRGINTILFGEYPWNRVESLPQGISRAKNWDEVLKLL